MLPLLEVWPVKKIKMAAIENAISYEILYILI